MTLDVHALDLLWEGESQILRLADYVAPARRAEFIAYARALVTNDETFGIDESFLGFITDYVLFAARINRVAEIADVPSFLGGCKGRITVYDVGCATALQHVLFDERVRYIGVDRHDQPLPQFFRDNCEFVPGYFADIAATLKVEPHDLGIANMSLYYVGTAHELALFDATFRRKIIL